MCRLLTVVEVGSATLVMFLVVYLSIATFGVRRHPIKSQWDEEAGLRAMLRESAERHSAIADLMSELQFQRLVLTVSMMFTFFIFLVAKPGRLFDAPRDEPPRAERVEEANA